MAGDPKYPIWLLKPGMVLINNRRMMNYDYSPWRTQSYCTAVCSKLKFDFGRKNKTVFTSQLLSEPTFDENGK